MGASYHARSLPSLPTQHHQHRSSLCVQRARQLTSTPVCANTWAFLTPRRTENVPIAFCLRLSMLSSLSLGLSLGPAILRHNQTSDE